MVRIIRIVLGCIALSFFLGAILGILVAKFSPYLK